MNSEKTASHWTQPIPKVELHAHLEGTLSPAFARQLAERHGERLPDSFVRDDETYAWEGVPGFLAAYDQAAAFVRTPEDYRDITFDYLRRAQAEGGIYVELICSYDHAAQQGLSYPTLVEAVVEGIRQAEQVFGIQARISQAIVRHYGVERAAAATNAVTAFSHPYVTGFQMAGAEDAGTASDFAPYFAQAREAGLRLHAHAGEWLGPESIRACLDAIPGLERIGHGVRAIEAPELVEELVARAITLEVCPLSNVATGVFSSAEHPFRALMEAGVKVTLSADDPPFFATSLGQEYAWAADEKGMSRAQLLAVSRNAAEAAFCDAELRAWMLSQIARFVSEPQNDAAS
jgi:adenosine deaminase